MKKEDRKAFHIPIFAGCPGLGKTRMLLESYELVKQELAENGIKRDVILLPVTYFNELGSFYEQEKEAPVAAFAYGDYYTNIFVRIMTGELFFLNSYKNRRVGKISMFKKL